MSDVVPGLPDSLLDSALERMDRIERAFQHIAKVIHLELADIALGPSLPDEQTVEKLHNLGQGLLGISGVSYDLLSGISEATGSEVTLQQPPVQTESAPGMSGTADTAGHQATERTSSDTSTQVPRQSSNTTRRQPHQPHTPSAPAEPAGSTQEPATEGAKEETVVLNGELYGAVVTLDRVPVMPPAGDGKAVELTIIGDERIELGGRQLTIKGHDLFLLNALLVLRDKPRAASELRELGFYPEATNGTAQVTFSNSMKNIALLINKAAKVEVIKRVGKARSTRYCVNPNLTLIDHRSEEQEALATDVEPDVKKN